MELIVIARPSLFKEECHLVNQLFEAGLQVFHLRKENASEADYRRIIEGILPEYHPRIALHHFHTLASDYNMKRIHHTESFRKSLQIEELAKNKVFSTSIHQLIDLDQIASYHYSFFSPVFNSFSKPGYKGIIPPGFRLKKTDTQPKIIALGGIGLNQIDQVKEMNFDGLALLGCIWNDPAQALTNFKKAQQHCLVHPQKPLKTS
ncbi:hypothetical protein CA265_20170 [Sphingobacteriaceae bacterium GW460-11-11-14-LB5]|nr:hypothetical protein CA265_20170 [Sphingobacteriaceae bacterium GW460-11-11-14-LB5]